MDCSPPGFSVRGDSPGKNTGVGCHALLQKIFPPQGSNLGLPLAGGFFTIWASREALWEQSPSQKDGNNNNKMGGPWLKSWGDRDPGLGSPTMNPWTLGHVWGLESGWQAVDPGWAEGKDTSRPNFQAHGPVTRGAWLPSPSQWRH